MSAPETRAATWIRIAVLTLACFACSSAFAAGADSRELVSVATAGAMDTRRLADAGLDLWEASADAALVYVTPREKEWLILNGYALTSRQAELDRRIATPRITDGYFTFAEFEQALAAWQTAHPQIATLHSIGKTSEGRDIWALRICGTPEGAPAKPAVLFTALQHAREWISGMTVHGITDRLLTSYGTDPEVTGLVDALEIWVVLVSNPDGYVYTHTTNRLWRKNRRNNGDGTFGVDTNRNLTYAWASGIASSSDVYPGPAPLSEPETTAITTLLASRRFVGHINYHSYGTRVMYNWAHTYEAPPNGDLMGDLMYGVSEKIRAVNGVSMRNGPWSIVLEYTGGGTTMDYMHGEMGVPSMSIELRPTEEDGGAFVIPGSNIAPSVAEVFPGTIHFLKWVGLHAGDPTPPQISAPEVTGISSTEATVRWKTDDPTTRVVEYGTTPAYSNRVQPDALRDIKHSVRLTGLTPSTTYHFQAGGANLADAEAWSGDLTFVTTAAAMDITPPQYPAIRVIRRTPAGQMQVIWSKLDSSPLAGYRLYESADGTTWTVCADESVLQPAMLTATLPAPPAGEVRLYRMTAVDSAPYRNESIPSDTYAVGAGAAPTRVLVVDGFDRWNSLAVAQGLNHEFAALQGLAVHAAGHPVDSCSNNAVEAGQVLLADYGVVVWVLGTESTSDETFSSAEQALVKTYLEGGGKLLVSGSEIAYDLGRSASTAADKAFLRDYLGCNYASDDFNGFTVYGTGVVSPFGSRRVNFDDGSQRIYRVGSPDSITAANPAVLALRTSSGQGAAVARRGLFGAGTASGGVVTMTFPVETVWGDSERNTLVAEALAYLTEPLSAVDDWSLY